MNSAVYSESIGDDNYVYTAFIMYDYLYMLKLKDSNTAASIIDWGFEFVLKAVIIGDQTIQPLFMFDDHFNSSVIYLAGSYD